METSQTPSAAPAPLLRTRPAAKLPPRAPPSATTPSARTRQRPCPPLTPPQCTPPLRRRANPTLSTCQTPAQSSKSLGQRALGGHPGVHRVRSQHHVLVLAHRGRTPRGRLGSSCRLRGSPVVLGARGNRGPEPRRWCGTDDSRGWGHVWAAGTFVQFIQDQKTPSHWNSNSPWMSLYSF